MAGPHSRALAGTVAGDGRGRPRRPCRQPVERGGTAVGAECGGSVSVRLRLRAGHAGGLLDGDR